MKHASLIAAAVALAAMPLLPATAMPRVATHAQATSSAIVLARGDHAWNYKLRLGRERDDAWSRGLRRFRNTFD